MLLRVNLGQSNYSATFPAGLLSRSTALRCESGAVGIVFVRDGFSHSLLQFVNAVSQLGRAFEIQLLGRSQHFAFKFPDELQRDKL